MNKRIVEETRRNFSGVWIPAERWLDENLSIVEIALITEIDSLDAKNSCFASNKHFAEFLGLSKGRISQLIAGLKEKGYITIEYETNGKQVIKRIIRVVNILNRGIKYSKAPIKNPKEGYLENAKDKNTGLRIQEKSTKEEVYSRAEPDSAAHYSAEIESVVDYLNQKAAKHYKSKTNKTRQLIRARFKEGFTLDDFKTVIDKKCSQWLNDAKMDAYLRPETLFGTKFEGYLNEKVQGRPVEPQHAKPYYYEKVDGKWTQNEINVAVKGIKNLSPQQKAYYVQPIDQEGNTRYRLDYLAGKAIPISDALDQL